MDQITAGEVFEPVAMQLNVNDRSIDGFEQHIRMEILDQDKLSRQDSLNNGLSAKHTR